MHTDAVDPFFVFLDLLKADNFVAEFGQRHMLFEAPQLDSLA
jgi:hypothetical protein